MKGLIAFEVARTRELLGEGAPLIGTLHGRERFAVAAFVSGADAALGAIERAGYDVLGGPPRASRGRRAVALAGRWRSGGGERDASVPGTGRTRCGWAPVSAASAHTRSAYSQCESLTRAAAGNFYYGIRLLPAPKRRAMCAVYAFARRVDDIADGTLAPEEKLVRLEAAAHALARLDPQDADPVMAALADASARFQLPADALDDLIEGVRMDVRGTSYANFGELELYCRRVAGSIGRLCLAIFGTRGPRAR